MSKNLDTYTFKDQKGQTLIKLPGSINGQVFNMEKLVDCTVYILDVSETIYIDNCVNCEFYVAPVKSSFFMRESQNSKCSVACKQLRVKNCTDFIFFLYCQSDPHIESSFDMKFAPYNFSYPNQDLDFRKAGFDPNNNRWCKVYDHSSSTGTHFSLLPASQFKKAEKNIDGYGQPVNPVPIPQQYGGPLKTEIIPGASPQPLPVANYSSPSDPPKPNHSLQVQAPEPVPWQLKKEDHDNTPKDIENEEISKTMSIFYIPSKGFEIMEQDVPEPFEHKELSDKLKLFSDISKSFYSLWSEYVYAMLLAVIGFLVIILIMSLLKMSSEWRVEALGLFLVFAIGSLIAILVICIIFLKKCEQTWKNEISKLEQDVNQNFFEGKNCKISAEMTVLTISLP